MSPRESSHRTNLQPCVRSVLLLALFVVGSCESTSPDPTAERPVSDQTPARDASCVTTGCDDGDACTEDRCELFAGRYSCTHRPVQCEDGRICDPDSGACIECFGDADCSDGQFCTGEEFCDAGTCGMGAAPCDNLRCDERSNTCTDCLGHSDCDDGVFCNGAEQCDDGACAPGEPPCAEDCDEELGRCGSAFTARILGCASSDIYFNDPLPLTAQIVGGFGERADIKWTIDAQHASISSILGTSTTLLIPQAEDIVVRVAVTDEARVDGVWMALEQTTAECLVPATSPKVFFAEAPVSGVLPQSFDAGGGDFQLSVSPVDRSGNLLTDGLTAASVHFIDVAVTPLGVPGSVITTGQATLQEVDVIKPNAPGEGVTVAISLDATGSMVLNDPDRLRVRAAQTLVGRLDREDLAAVLEFSWSYPITPGMHGSRLLQDFTNDHDLLNSAIAGVSASGGTPFYDAVLDAVTLVAAEALYNPAVVLLTDGEENSSTVATFETAVAAAFNAGIPLYLIGLGEEVDFSGLQEMARRTGGTFASALVPEELEALFHSLGTAVTVGRVVVTAELTFATPVTVAGFYTVSGSVEITIDEQTRSSPFSFQVTIGNPPVARSAGADLELALPCASP